MYYFFFDKFMLPVPPQELNISVGSKNETVDLINGGSMNVLRSPALQEISFSFVIPSQKYPYANYFMSSKAILDMLYDFKLKKAPFQFIVTRLNKTRFDYFTNIKVCLESYEVNENAENGMDIVVHVNLKQYVEYHTKKLTTKDGKTYVERVRG